MVKVKEPDIKIWFDEENPMHIAVEVGEETSTGQLILASFELHRKALLNTIENIIEKEKRQ